MSREQGWVIGWHLWGNLYLSDLRMRSYLVVFERTKTGYSAYVPDLPGVIATGKTKVITSKNIYTAIQFHIKGMLIENLIIPKGETQGEIMEFTLK